MQVIEHNLNIDQNISFANAHMSLPTCPTSMRKVLQGVLDVFLVLGPNQTKKSAFCTTTSKVVQRHCRDHPSEISAIHPF